jgi:hypothetical protein
VTARWLDEARDPGRRALRQALDEGAIADQPLAKQRVWNRVQAPWADPRRGGWRLPLLLGVAIGSAAVLLVLALRPVPAIVRVSAPPAPPGVIPLPADPRQHLARGVEAELAPRSVLVPGDEQTPPEVRGGRVRFSVPHQEPGHRYLVRARGYQVVVVGTTFVVGVADGSVDVAVESGVVQVEDAATGRRLARLEPGQRWSSQTPPPRRRVAAAVPGDAVSAGALDEARRLRQSDPQRALALYQRLASSHGPLAEIALYEMGAIEDEGLRDPRRALGTWERYRERYPRGMLRAEADFSLIEVLARLREQTRALDEARAFLRRYPQSERRGEIAVLAADLARTGGDCTLAVTLYDTAARARLPPPLADDAAFNRAACLAAAGDARASAAARDYLARFPAGTHRPEAGRLLGASTVAPGGF